jgi:holo-[acyl-carrier protein] synthase
MIVGIGVDIVDVERFERAVTRTPRLIDRLFTPAERDNTMRSLAARFAAKEAFIKAMGGSGESSWHEMEVVSAPSGAPRLNLTGRAATLATDNHVTNVQLSLSHDGGQAIAFVVAEGSAS